MNLILNIWKNVSYANTMGFVMYTRVCTRPVMAHAITTLNRFMVDFEPKHWETLEWLLKYLKRTSQLGLVFKTYSDRMVLKGFVDADFTVDRGNGKSTTAYMFTLWNLFKLEIFVTTYNSSIEDRC